MTALLPSYRAAVDALGFDWSDLRTAEQVHGCALAEVTRVRDETQPVPGVDGLLTASPGTLLGIVVADCCAVSIVDPVHRAVALVHSGKRGTEENITGKAIQQMSDRYQSKPSDLLVHLSPCIRPPHYEVDFAAEIKRQVKALGVQDRHLHDEGHCTASDPDRFYSYRRERGRTGRMLALLGYRRESPGSQEVSG